MKFGRGPGVLPGLTINPGALSSLLIVASAFCMSCCVTLSVALRVLWFLGSISGPGGFLSSTLPSVSSTLTSVSVCEARGPSTVGCGIEGQLTI